MRPRAAGLIHSACVPLLLGSSLEVLAVPLISYSTSPAEGGRQLIFSNNPEEIRAEPGACDLSDGRVGALVCNRTLLRLDSLVGSFRDWFEHRNATSRSIVYGIRLRNPGPGEAYAVLRGSGLTQDSAVRGGQEFVDLWGNPLFQVTRIPSGQSALLFRTTPIAPLHYFAGVVDFDLSGNPVDVENLAYAVEPSAQAGYAGYIQRVFGSVRESLVYKGLSPDAQAIASEVNFSISDATPIGRLPVAYRRYLSPSEWGPGGQPGRCQTQRVPLCSGNMGGFEAEPTVRDSWVTHIGPDGADPNPKRRNAVVTDMIRLFMPGLPEGCRAGGQADLSTCFEISPYFQWHYPDAEEWRYANLGNWAVHYRIQGAVDNSGSRTRRMHFGLRGDGASPLAFRCNQGAWRQIFLKKADPNNPNDYLPYCEFDAFAWNTTPYVAEMVLSGPATGTLEQFVRVASE